MNMTLAGIALLGAGCGGASQETRADCQVEVAGVCHAEQAEACVAANCPTERCILLDTEPARVDCSESRVAAEPERPFAEVIEQFCAVEGPAADDWYQVHDARLWRTVFDLVDAGDAERFAAGMRDEAIRAGLADCPRAQLWAEDERPPYGEDASLPMQAIADTVRAKNSTIRRCYEAGLARDPALAGRVTVRFVMGPEGDVLVALAKDEMGDRSVAECLADVIRLLRFEAPGGLLSVTYPFMFSAVGQ